jgi:hypothetical protein
MSGFWFAAGALLMTGAGERQIETLRCGDELVTIREDGPESRRIMQISPAPAPSRLVRISAGAFAPLMPARALVLAADHAVYADGALFEIAELCTAGSITIAPASEAQGWRIALEAHDVVLAEGLPVECGPAAPGIAAAAGSNVVILHPGRMTAGGAARCLPVLSEGAACLALRRMLAYRAGGAARVLRR